MAKKQQNTTPQTLDNQLVEWRKKFAKEIPERVGLAFYTNEKGETEVEAYFADDNMWLSQATMAQLFDVEEHTITYHIKEIYKSGELEEIPTTRKIRAVRTEGVRQVAIELKLGKFQAAYKGQMELYLRWLDKNMKLEDENTPIGLILCAGKSEEHIELLQLENSNIKVADYLTQLPDKHLLEQKLRTAIEIAKQRLESKENE
ncbi:MAG: PDDEXK nuclease domain-containing protein [Bacteroidales bacterium]|jgi:hypothetical protein|nr:PDDEXK nuclease domain-containing protein [Bacteroidales bacterium]